MEELVFELEKLVGVNVPGGTLRRWAHQGLIPGPKSGGRQGRRGCFYNWPRESLEQAAVIYTLRNSNHSNIPRADTETKTLLAAKKTVDRYYKSFADFLVTRDRAILLNTLLELCEWVSVRPLWTCAPEGWTLPPEGYVLTSEKLQPLTVMWIAALEKIRHDEPLDETFTVIFTVDSYVVCENAEKSIKAKNNAITFEPSDCDCITLNFGNSYAALKK